MPSLRPLLCFCVVAVVGGGSSSGVSATGGCDSFLVPGQASGPTACPTLALSACDRESHALCCTSDVPSCTCQARFFFSFFLLFFVLRPFCCPPPTTPTTTPNTSSCDTNESAFEFENGAVLCYHFAHKEGDKSIEDALKIQGTELSDYDAVIANPGNEPRMEVGICPRFLFCLVGEEKGWFDEIRSGWAYMKRRRRKKLQGASFSCKLGWVQWHQWPVSRADSL